MANKESVIFNGKKVNFYSVDGAVGIGTTTNKPEDVALVQYLLLGYFRKASLKPLGSMAIDGVYGAKTHYWSLFFYLVVSGKDDFAFIEKGNFLPKTDARFGSSSLSSDMMMWQLNAYFRKTNPSAPNDLENDPGFPAILKGRIK
jgi:hypothetical protein